MGRGLLEDPSSYVTTRDLDLEEEESDLPDDFWYRTELSCSSCEELLCFNEEILLVQIVQGQHILEVNENTGLQSNVLQFYPVLNEEEDFEYEPLLIHFDCWEQICDEFHELIADEPKLRSRTPTSDLCRCSFCKTGIGPWEEFARVILGELTISERKRATVFQETEGGSPEPVCIGCVDRINEQCIELWKS
jgi:hypothetical protein